MHSGVVALRVANHREIKQLKHGSNNKPKGRLKIPYNEINDKFYQWDLKTSHADIFTSERRRDKDSSFFHLSGGT